MSEDSGTPDLALRSGIAAALSGAGAGTLGSSAEQLMSLYRSGERPTSPILSTATSVAAYAAYGMPATVGAITAALRQLKAVMPDWAPVSHLDLGAGTGAAAWAVADQFPTMQSIMLLEQVPQAIELGRRIQAGSQRPALRSAAWRQWRISEQDETFAAVDLATISYLLGELDETQRIRVVRAAAASAHTVVVVEAGTPAGYRRILVAREQLMASGLTVIAPCPHQLDCPLATSRKDWCHFSERVDRSALHRQLKAAERSFEDEKFAFVAASRDGGLDRPAARVIRRPQRRKGLVALRVCASSGCAEERLVSRRLGAVYQAATKTRWGDPWPPGPDWGRRLR